MAPDRLLRYLQIKVHHLIQDHDWDSRLGAGPMETVARAVMKPVAQQETRGAWYREWLLTAVDGTTFTVPDTDDNEREFGRPGSGRGEGRTAYPQIQAACLVEVGTHAVFDARMDAYAAGEAMLIEEMFPSLRPGMLVLADRHVYSFRRWLAAAATGADLAWSVGEPGAAARATPGRRVFHR